MMRFVRFVLDFLWKVWEAVVCQSALHLLICFALFFACFLDYTRKPSDKGNEDGDSPPRVFQRLVSDDEAKKSVLSGVGFVLVWLVGGGLLVGFIVRRCYWLEHGGFRRCQWLLKDHLVVLGWDDGQFSELLEASKLANGCYVLTNQDAFALQGRLRRAGLKDVCVYAGDYDDPAEWGPLNLACAQKVFVSGEGNEEAHDARVLMVSKALEGDFPESEFRDFKQVVNVWDFGLANKLQSTSRIKFENFHLKWSWYLISRLSFEHSEGGLNALIVGSGAMGQAVVWAAFKKYGKSINVVFTDDEEEKLLKERPRFLKQTWNGQMPEFCDWATAKTKAGGFCEAAKQPNGKPLVVVVAKKRSEKGWTSLIDLLQQKLVNCYSEKIVFALSQEIGGWVVGGMNNGELRLDSGPGIRLFGFKRGVCVDV